MQYVYFFLIGQNLTKVVFQKFETAILQSIEMSRSVIDVLIY